MLARYLQQVREHRAAPAITRYALRAPAQRWLHPDAKADELAHLIAELAGISPIPASSGQTSGRHRINHGDHRQLNAAIYRTVTSRMRFHEPTIAYVAHRTAEGKSKRDIIRCLKRYVIREVYKFTSGHQIPTKNVA